MNKSQHKTATLLIVSLLAISLTSCTKQNLKPNIIFFFVDDLGWTDVACYGSPFYETPNIDLLAEEGVRFTDAYAACHVCSPTRASVLTGKYPATLNLTDWLTGRKDTPFQKLLNADKVQNLPYEETSIAEALKGLGYKTAILGKWHLGEDPSDPTAHGFDMHLPDWAKGWPKKGYFAPFDMKGFEDSEDGDYLTDRLTDEAVKYIETMKHEPFFLYMSHFTVHDPIQGRPDLVEKYKKKLKNQAVSDRPDFILEGNPDNPNNPSNEELAEFMNTPEFLNNFKTFPSDLALIKQKQDNIEFAGMVESMDESLGRIMKKLKELKLEENTIIFFYSDNGGMAGMNGTPKRELKEHQLDEAYSTANLPLRGAKGWLYEGGIRVPLIIKHPKIGKAGIQSDLPVSSVDMYPTILNMVDAPELIADDIEGINISPAIRGETMTRGAIYWHFPHYSNHGMQSPGGAIREGDYKLLEYFENGTVQLFNLKNDIGEQTDLSKIEIGKTKELKIKLQQWRDKVNANMMLPNPNYDQSADLWSNN